MGKVLSTSASSVSRADDLKAEVMADAMYEDESEPEDDSFPSATIRRDFENASPVASRLGVDNEDVNQILLFSEGLRAYIRDHIFERGRKKAKKKEGAEVQMKKLVTWSQQIEQTCGVNQGRRRLGLAPVPIHLDTLNGIRNDQELTAIECGKREFCPIALGKASLDGVETIYERNPAFAKKKKSYWVGRSTDVVKGGSGFFEDYSGEAKMNHLTIFKFIILKCYRVLSNATFEIPQVRLSMQNVIDEFNKDDVMVKAYQDFGIKECLRLMYMIPDVSIQNLDILSVYDDRNPGRNFRILSFLNYTKKYNCPPEKVIDPSVYNENRGLVKERNLKRILSGSLDGSSYPSLELEDKANERNFPELAVCGLMGVLAVSVIVGEKDVLKNCGFVAEYNTKTRSFDRIRIVKLAIFSSSTLNLDFERKPVKSVGKDAPAPPQEKEREFLFAGEGNGVVKWTSLSPSQKHEFLDVKAHHHHLSLGPSLSYLESIFEFLVFREGKFDIGSAYSEKNDTIPWTDSKLGNLAKTWFLEGMKNEAEEYEEEVAFHLRERVGKGRWRELGEREERRGDFERAVYWYNLHLKLLKKGVCEKGESIEGRGVFSPPVFSKKKKMEIASVLGVIGHALRKGAGGTAQELAKARIVEGLSLLMGETNRDAVFARAGFLEDLGNIYDSQKVHDMIVLQCFSLAYETYDALGRSYLCKRCDCDSCGVKGVEVLERGLKIKERIYPSTHITIADSAHMMGLAFLLQGKAEKSIEWSGRAIDIKEKVLERNDPSLGESFGNLAEGFLRLGEFRKAVGIGKKSLKIGVRKSCAILVYGVMAKACEELGEWETAISHGKEALKIYCKFSGMRGVEAIHRSVTVAVEACYKCFVNGLGQRELGFSYLSNLLEVKRKYLPVSHVGLGETQMDLGRLCLDLKRWDESLKYFESALEIFVSDNEKDVSEEKKKMVRKCKMWIKEVKRGKIKESILKGEGRETNTPVTPRTTSRERIEWDDEEEDDDDDDDEIDQKKKKGFGKMNQRVLFSDNEMENIILDSPVRVDVDKKKDLFETNTKEKEESGKFSQTTLLYYLKILCVILLLILFLLYSWTRL